jgi:hypothetical protein
MQVGVKLSRAVIGWDEPLDPDLIVIIVVLASGLWHLRSKSKLGPIT